MSDTSSQPHNSDGRETAVGIYPHNMHPASFRVFQLRINETVSVSTKSFSPSRPS